MATRNKTLPSRPVYQPGARSIGIDPSLASTGVAIYTDRDRWHVTRIDTPPHDGTLPGLFRRLDTIRNTVLEVVDGFQPTDIVTVEGFMLASAANRGPIVANWFHIVEAIVRAGITPVVVAPATRAKYATGSGGGGKDRVMAQVFKRFPEAWVDTNDEADAVFLAAIGRHLAGHPIEPAPLPATHLSVDNLFAPLP